MNPNRGGEQPAPHFESASAGPEQFIGLPEQAEAQPKTPESSPSRQTGPVTTAPQAPVLSTVPAPAPIPDDNKTTTTRTVADSHRIEKEWIERAKAIVSQAKDDPFVQKNEMSKVKAAYIEKRFNKKIKTDEALA